MPFQQKIAELTNSIPLKEGTNNNIRMGFVYYKLARITLKSIANNVEIDQIWANWHQKAAAPLKTLNSILNTNMEEWEVPRRPNEKWPEEAVAAHREWYLAVKNRQEYTDQSIQKNADQEVLFDSPFEAKGKIRVSGPFTVESLSPHRTMIVDDDDSLIDPYALGQTTEVATQFDQMILDTLRVAGVQQAHKDDHIDFKCLNGWPGSYISAKATYREADGSEKSAGIFIGPEFGTVSRVDLVEAARECADAGFDVLISCAFNYEAQSTEFDKLLTSPAVV